MLSISHVVHHFYRGHPNTYLSVDTATSKDKGKSAGYRDVKYKGNNRNRSDSDEEYGDRQKDERRRRYSSDSASDDDRNDRRRDYDKRDRDYDRRDDSYSSDEPRRRKRRDDYSDSYDSRSDSDRSRKNRYGEICLVVIPAHEYIHASYFRKRVLFSSACQRTGNGVLSELLALSACVLLHEYQCVCGASLSRADDERSDLSDDSRDAGDTNPGTLGRKMYRNSMNKNDGEAVREILHICGSCIYSVSEILYFVHVVLPIL